MVSGQVAQLTPGEAWDVTPWPLGSLGHSWPYLAVLGKLAPVGWEGKACPCAAPCASVSPLRGLGLCCARAGGAQPMPC